ncbi:MAG: type II 3-dehydroquinate dehydratase [bacterium]
MKVLVIQGPNLNLLGKREEEIYGGSTLEEINSELAKVGKQLGVEVFSFQSNHEGEIVDAIQGAPVEEYEAIIINPAAYTHTSVAIRDALLAVGLPYYEVHISNIFAREEFRQRSLISDGASGIVTGFGTVGYTLALQGVSRHRDIQ